MSLHRDDCARLLRLLVDVRVGKRKHVVRGDRQEGAIESPVQIAIVGADGIVDGDEIGAHGEGAFDHQLGERRNDRGLHVTAAQHGLADGHEVRDRVVAIADELYAFSMRKHMRMQPGAVLLAGCSQ
jgi:hypothetical protein